MRNSKESTAAADAAVASYGGGRDRSLLRPSVCFSFAAYSKSVIEHLRTRGVPIDGGLSDAEFSAVESAHDFRFPPDLRSILREGLPVGPGFPNWRSASPQQLHILLSLPISGLLHEISSPGSFFWPRAWGPRPRSPSDPAAQARSRLAGAPKLVPVYRQFYIAGAPSLAGNPLFHVRGGEVRCCALDLADFFRREEVFCLPAPAPAWAAKVARRVAIWTALSEGGGGGEMRVEALMEELGWRLREGGWAEEEVREMLEGSGGCGEATCKNRTEEKGLDVRVLARQLLRAGWSEKDVVYSLGGNSTNRIGTRGPHSLDQVSFDVRLTN